MISETPVLQGQYIRLEPLELRHADGLAAASTADGDLCRWSPVPRGKTEAELYIETTLSWKSWHRGPVRDCSGKDGLVHRIVTFLES